MRAGSKGKFSQSVSAFRGSILNFRLNTFETVLSSFSPAKFVECIKWWYFRFALDSSLNPFDFPSLRDPDLFEFKEQENFFLSLPSLVGSRLEFFSNLFSTTVLSFSKKLKRGIIFFRGVDRSLMTNFFNFSLILWLFFLTYSRIFSIFRDRSSTFENLKKGIRFFRELDRSTTNFIDFVIINI